jgi:chromosomal replication initiator protein
VYAVQMPAALPPKEAWEVARSQLRLQMTKSTYDTWVRDTVCLAHEDGAFVIGVPNAYARDWLAMRLRGLITRTLSSIVGRTVEVSFVVRPTTADGAEATAGPLLELESTVETDQSASRADSGRSPAAGGPARPAPLGAPLPAPRNGLHAGEPDDHPGDVFPATLEPVEPKAALPLPAAPLTQAASLPITEGANLNPRYTFDHFIVGSSNRMAHAVAMAVAEKPGRAYNPLFLYGGVGLGKTHLLQAIGHAAQDKGLAVLYVSSESFTNDMISAIRTQSTEQFRAKYRTIDVLLIDDVHFIAGKEQTQEEFFHTFNTLYAANRQIVMTSDRPPQAIATLEERLRSRFGWGMTADIQPPNLETRIAILQARAASLGLAVPDDVLVVVAQRAHRNIRDLEGALTRVLAHAQLMGRPLNPSLVEDALAYLAPTQSKLTLDEILEVAAIYFGIRTADLTGRNRSARIALQRQIVMYVMREETGASLPQIGAALGSRDHTTVMHGVERVGQQIESDAGLRREVTELRERLYQPTRRNL